MSATKSATDVRERPILFSGPMVRAILAGNKTQTRRVVKWKPLHEGLNLSASSLSVGHYCTGVPSSGFVLYSRDGRGVWNQRTERMFCPYGKPGDRLWVREAWGDVTGAFQSHESDEPRVWAYRADEAVHNDGGFLEHMDDSGIVCKRWRPSIHMPRWMSRITLEITNVRVERLQDITPHDACAEGVTMFCQRHDPSMDICHAAFAQGWDELNKARGFGWDTNCWVWVIDFRKTPAR